MRKFILSSLFIAGMAISSYAGSFSGTVLAGTFTNLYSFGPNVGSLVVRTVSLTAPASTNVSLIFVDTPTNILVFTNAAYTNRIQYATNVITSYTNYYGVAVLYTNLGLITATNTVAAGTNAYPIRGIYGAAINSSAVYNPAVMYFDAGIWVTNNSGGTAVVNVTY